jgi:hypothetical protein
MHLDVTKVFLNFKRSGSFYLLMSNNFGWENSELDQNAGGTSRHLDAMAEPFLFPTPIWRTNYLGLWRLSDVDEKALQVLKESLSVVD